MWKFPLGLMSAKLIMPPIISVQSHLSWWQQLRWNGTLDTCFQFKALIPVKSIYFLRFPVAPSQLLKLQSQKSLGLFYFILKWGRREKTALSFPSLLKKSDLAQGGPELKPPLMFLRLPHFHMWGKTEGKNKDKKEASLATPSKVLHSPHCHSQAPYPPQHYCIYLFVLYLFTHSSTESFTWLRASWRFFWHKVDTISIQWMN